MDGNGTLVQPPTTAPIEPGGEEGTDQNHGDLISLNLVKLCLDEQKFEFLFQYNWFLSTFIVASACRIDRERSIELVDFESTMSRNTILIVTIFMIVTFTILKYANAEVPVDKKLPKTSEFIRIEDNMVAKVQQNFYLAISILGVVISGVVDVCMASFH